jgi:hypothetical protein
MLMPSRSELIAAARSAVAAEAVKIAPTDNAADAGDGTADLFEAVIETVVDAVVATITGSQR